MKKIVLGLIVLVSLAFIQADTFPDLEGKTLDNKIVSIPKDTKGKYTFIALAFSRKAEDALNTWAEPLYYHFMPESREGKTLMFGMDYDVNLYLIPMFTGANKALEGKARKEAIKHMDKRLHSRTMFFKGNNDVKKALGIKKKDVPYFFLLDENGKIVHETSGFYSDEKMIPIENILDEAAE